MEFDLHTLLRYQNVIWYGLWMTVFMSVVSLAIGAAIGLLACIGKLSERGLGYHLASGFIDFFRTIPEVVIIFWVYSCLPILMQITMSAEVCAILALSLFAGAFLAEIFRAGVLAVPPGQVEAANALGIPIYHIWRKIILPVAIRRMVPAFVNFLTDLVKASALLSAIGIGELFYQASVLGNTTYRHMEFFTAIAVLYFAVIFPLSVYARRSERRLVARTGQ